MTGLILQIIGLDDEDYVIHFYIERENMISLRKSDLVKVYDQEGVKYYALIDGLERGHLMCSVEIVDNEAYWKEGKRPVVINGHTGYDIGLCGGEGRTLSCSGYEVTFKAVQNIPKNERGVFAGVVAVGFYDLSEDDIMELPVTDESVFYIEAKPGERVVVAVPYDGGKAEKDNGWGEKIPFNTAIDGANGVQKEVNDVIYRVYGELCIVEGKYKIYIG